jgi:hypothetical protein
VPVLEADACSGISLPLAESISADGYVRFAPARLRAIGFVHCLSGLDPDPLDEFSAGAGATTAVIAGFTEWASATRPALSLGWDWVAEVLGSRLRYCRSGEPRSNILLLNPQQRDLGYEQNLIALGLAVDELHWQDTVAAYVLARYA